MKKILAFLLALIFVFALSACDNNDVAINNNSSENIVDSSREANLQSENSQSEKSEAENSQSPQTQKGIEAETTTSTQETVKVEVVEAEQNKSTDKTETNNNNTQTTTVNNANITREKAIEIALTHAKLKETNVYDLDAELDRETNATVWEVDFETKEYEYSYEIDVKTGSIIKSNKEPQDDDKNEVEQQKTEEVVQSTQITITRERAIEIALSHAGLKRVNAQDLDAELDKEKNGSFWEIDFETKEYEYSYSINAVTEEIITSEKERN